MPLKTTDNDLREHLFYHLETLQDGSLKPDYEAIKQVVELSKAIIDLKKAQTEEAKVKCDIIKVYAEHNGLTDSKFKELSQ